MRGLLLAALAPAEVCESGAVSLLQLRRPVGCSVTAEGPAKLRVEGACGPAAEICAHGRTAAVTGTGAAWTLAQALPDLRTGEAVAPGPCGYELVGTGHCAGAGGAEPCHVFKHDVPPQECREFCSKQHWCQAFHWSFTQSTCAVFPRPGSADEAPVLAAALRDLADSLGWVERSDHPVLEVVGTDGRSATTGCFRKWPEARTISDFIAEQLETAEACAAKVLEAQRTSDGLDARVQALKARYDAVRAADARARADLEAAAAALPDAAKEERAELEAAVATGTTTVLRSEHELLALHPELLEAHKDLTRVAAHLERLRATCVESGAVSPHLERIRTLIQVLPDCPGRNDFTLTIPTLPDPQGAPDPLAVPDAACVAYSNPVGRVGWQIGVEHCGPDFFPEEICLNGRTFAVEKSWRVSRGPESYNLNLAKPGVSSGGYQPGDAVTAGACAVAFLELGGQDAAEQHDLQAFFEEAEPAD